MRHHCAGQCVGYAECGHQIVGGVDPAFAGTLTGFLAADNVTAAYSRAAGETVAGGTYVIRATITPTTVLSNYNIAYSTAQFTISQLSAKVGPTAAGKAYGTPDPALTGSLLGFLPADNVTATYTRTTGGTVAGSPYVISATLAPTAVLANYNILYSTANFTISAAAASVTPAASGKVYGATDPALAGTLSGFLPADNVTVTSTRVAGERGYQGRDNHNGLVFTQPVHGRQKCPIHGDRCHRISAKFIVRNEESLRCRCGCCSDGCWRRC